MLSRAKNNEHYSYVGPTMYRSRRDEMAHVMSRQCTNSYNYNVPKWSCTELVMTFPA